MYQIQLGFAEIKNLKYINLLNASLKWGSWAVIQNPADTFILSFPPSWLHNPAYVGVLYFPVQIYTVYHTREVMGQTRCNSRTIVDLTRAVQAHIHRNRHYRCIQQIQTSLWGKSIDHTYAISYAFHYIEINICDCYGNSWWKCRKNSRTIPCWQK